MLALGRNSDEFIVTPVSTASSPGLHKQQASPSLHCKQEVHRLFRHEGDVSSTLLDLLKVI